MLEIIYGIVLTLLGGTMLAIIPWAFRLEGRVNVQDVKQEDLKELILAKLQALDDRTKRIESRINGKP